jgi:hypothetical protein
VTAARLPWHSTLRMCSNRPQRAALFSDFSRLSFFFSHFPLGFCFRFSKRYYPSDVAFSFWPCRASLWDRSSPSKTRTAVL